MLNDDGVGGVAKPDAAAREQMSALVDGELSADALAGACADWRQQEDARAAWHAYHVIGDALRSDDLCRRAGHDARFLESLRARLAHEPVVLAPARLEPAPIGANASAPVISAPAALAPAARSAAGRRRGWMASSAVAAGFAAVAFVTLLTGSPNNGSPPLLPEPPTADTLAAAAPQTASNPIPAAMLATRRMSAGAGAENAPSLVATGTVIRDAGLDRHLSEHRQFVGSSALGMPSGFYRDATTDAAR